MAVSVLPSMPHAKRLSKSHDLNGPELKGMHGFTEDYAAVLGRPVTYVPLGILDGTPLTGTLEVAADTRRTLLLLGVEAQSEIDRLLLGPDLGQSHDPFQGVVIDVDLRHRHVAPPARCHVRASDLQSLRTLNTAGSPGRGSHPQSGRSSRGSFAAA
ncbi:hypothetical protein GCM10023083_08860 [Streptomyces phyllanthi]